MNLHDILIPFAKRVVRFSAIAVLLTHSVESTARAATVASYTFAGNSLASSDTDPSSAAADIVVGAGLSGSTTFFTAFIPAYGATSDHIPASLGAAMTANDYLSFTITPSSGVSLAYSSMNFNFAFSGFSFPYVANVDVFWSVDSFASTLGTNTLDPGFSNTSLQGKSVTLNPALVQSGPVEFRFYFYDTQNTSFDTMGIAALSLIATVVPEPASTALLLAGCFVLALRRR